MRQRFSLYGALVVAVLGIGFAGCGGDNDNEGGGGSTKVSGTVSMSAVWTGQEARSFQKVLDGFQQKYPNVNVKFRPVGDEIPTVLSTAVAGGNPPDVAAIAQPGLVRDFVDRNALKPIDFAKDTLEENFSKDVIDVATVEGKP